MPAPDGRAQTLRRDSQAPPGPPRWPAPRCHARATPSLEGERPADRVRPRGEENEDRQRRGLFERFQQRILRRGHQRVRFVEHDDATAPFEWPIRRTLDHVANLIDLDRPGITGFDDNDVGVDATLDSGARRTDAAGVCHRLPTIVSSQSRGEAIERLSDGERRLTFGDPLRSGKEQAGRQGATRDGSRKQLDETLVAGNIPKGHDTGILSLDAVIKASAISLRLAAAWTLRRRLWRRLFLWRIVISAAAEEPPPEAALPGGRRLRTVNLVDGRPSRPQRNRRAGRAGRRRRRDGWFDGARG